MRDLIRSKGGSVIGEYHRNPITGKRGGTCIEVWVPNSPVAMIKTMESLGFVVTKNAQNLWGSNHITFYKDEDDNQRDT